MEHLVGADPLQMELIDTPRLLGRSDSERKSKVAIMRQSARRRKSASKCPELKEWMEIPALWDSGLE